MRMNITFKQYTPADLYIGVGESETLEADCEMDDVTGFRPVGGPFLNAFVNNLHYLGIHSTDFHAKKLGISSDSLCLTVETLTGMSYSDFAAQYVLLMATDLLKNRKHTELKSIAKRLGFGSYSGFYRFMLRNGKGKPSWV